MSIWIIKQIYTLWMAFAKILGKINTFIILSIIYVVLISPIGLILRIFKKDILNLKFNPKSESYWQKRNSQKEISYENQF